MGGKPSKESKKEELTHSTPAGPVEKVVTARPVGGGSHIKANASPVPVQQFPVETDGPHLHKDVLPQPVVHHIGPHGIPPIEIAKQFAEEQVPTETQTMQLKSPAKQTLAHAVPGEPIRMKAMSGSNQKPLQVDDHGSGEIGHGHQTAQAHLIQPPVQQTAQEFPIDTVEVPFNKAVKQPVHWKVKPDPAHCERKVEGGSGLAHELVQDDQLEPHVISIKHVQAQPAPLPVPTVHGGDKVTVISLQNPQEVHVIESSEEHKKLFAQGNAPAEMPKQNDIAPHPTPAEEIKEPVVIDLPPVHHEAHETPLVNYGPFDPSKPQLKETICGPDTHSHGPSGATKEDIEYLATHAHQAHNVEVAHDVQIPSSDPGQSHGGIQQAALIHQTDSAGLKPELADVSTPNEPTQEEPQHQAEHRE